MLTKTKKAKVIKEVQLHATDTGSAEAQIAILSKRIDDLAKHLKKHKADKGSRRGLLQLVADRQAHLQYLQKNHPQRHQKVTKSLDLKKKTA
jgi:small subunit ribosomal protein S15